MSRAWALVRFPDGEVKLGLYNGTADLLYPMLLDGSLDAAEAWSLHHHQDPWVDPEPPVEQVIIYSSYCSGTWWEGQAGRNAVCSRDCDPWDQAEDGIEHELHRGETPEWVKAWLDSKRQSEPADPERCPACGRPAIFERTDEEKCRPGNCDAWVIEAVFDHTTRQWVPPDKGERS